MIIRAIVIVISVIVIWTFALRQAFKFVPIPHQESCETLGKYCAEFETQLAEHKNPQLALTETDSQYGGTDLNHIIAGALWSCSPGFAGAQDPAFVAENECRTYCQRLDHDRDKIAAALRDECGVEK